MSETATIPWRPTVVPCRHRRQTVTIHFVRGRGTTEVRVCVMCRQEVCRRFTEDHGEDEGRA